MVLSRRNHHRFNFPRYTTTTPSLAIQIDNGKINKDMKRGERLAMHYNSESHSHIFTLFNVIIIFARSYVN